MLILTIRTDKPEAEIGLYNDGQQLVDHHWQADRALSDSLHRVIQEQLQTIHKAWSDINSVVYFAGPGSFTGLRIGAAVANALGVPVVSEQGDAWREQGIKRLLAGESGLAQPHYGAEAHTTQQKK